MDQVLKVQIRDTKSELYKRLDSACFKSARLYNYALYDVRQEFAETGGFPSYPDLHSRLKYDTDSNGECPYERLPSTVSQETIRYLSMAITSYKNAIKDYNNNPSKYRGEPRSPSYLPKNGLYPIYLNRSSSFSKKYSPPNKIVCLTNSKTTDLRGITFTLPKLIKAHHVKGIRIVPHHNIFDIEFVYEKQELPLRPDNGKAIAIDFGVNNFIATVDNAGFRPFVVKGNVIKSINHSYNKAKAKAQALLPKKVYSSSYITKLGLYRQNAIRDHFHKISKALIIYCSTNNINTIVIGSNKYWKQNIKLGSKVNQKFVSIPYYKFKQMIKYKAELYGLNVIEIDEAYTSKCSALDNESVQRHSAYAGIRIARGLFKSSTGIVVNADINAAANILRKAGFNFAITPKCLSRVDSFIAATARKSNPISTTKVVRFGYGC